VEKCASPCFCTVFSLDLFFVFLHGEIFVVIYDARSAQLYLTRPRIIFSVAAAVVLHYHTCCRVAGRCNGELAATGRDLSAARRVKCRIYVIFEG